MLHLYMVAFICESLKKRNRRSLSFSHFLRGIYFCSWHHSKFFAGTYFRGWRKNPWKPQKLIATKVNPIKVSQGHLSAIIDASMFCLIHLIDEAWRRTFLVNEWVGLFFRCFEFFWTFLYIFMFLPSNFNISYTLTNVWLLTTTYTFVNHTWWMEIFTFQLKQLFNFLSDPLNTNIVFIISEKSNFFTKRLESSSFFEQYVISTNTTFFGTSKKPGGLM